MKLIDDWKAVMKRAWSIRLILIAGLFSGLEAAVQIATLFAADITWLPRGWFALIAFVASNGAFVMRLVAQKEISGGKQ